MSGMEHRSKRTTETLINIQIICRNQERNVSCCLCRCLYIADVYWSHCSVSCTQMKFIHISRREYEVNNDLVVWMHVNCIWTLPIYSHCDAKMTILTCSIGINFLNFVCKAKCHRYSRIKYSRFFSVHRTPYTMIVCKIFNVFI